MLKKLHKKDKRILIALDMNARTPDSQIAKIVGLSKQAVNYRIKKLEQIGLIKSYSVVIDHTGIGLRLYRAFLKFENLNKEKEKEILDYISKRSTYLASLLGKWDISFAVHAKDEYAFMSFWQSFFDRFSYYINGKLISLMTTFWNFERSFIYSQKSNRDSFFVLGVHKQKKNIDDIDLQILSELTLNARQTSFSIARKINQTERIVRYRIKKLEDQKTILGYRPFIDTNMLGFKFYKLFIGLKNSRKSDINKIRKYITQNPNVTYSTETLGGPDFEVEANFRDSHELFNFVTKLKEVFPKQINSIEHLEYIKEYKLSYFPLNNLSTEKNNKIKNNS